MTLIQRFDHALWGIEQAQIICSWVITVLVTLMIVLDIFLRFFFNHPLPASWEISEVVMPYLVIFGFAYALNKNFHVRVSLILDHLPRKANFACAALANMSSFLMCMILTYWSWLRFWESFLLKEEILAAIPIPWWVGKLAMPIAFGTLGARYLMNLFLDIRRKSLAK